MDLTDMFQNVISPQWIIKCLFFKVVLQWSSPSPMLFKTFVNNLEEHIKLLLTNISDGTKSEGVENNEK